MPTFEKLSQIGPLDKYNSTLKKAAGLVKEGEWKNYAFFAAVVLAPEKKGAASRTGSVLLIDYDPKLMTELPKPKMIASGIVTLNASGELRFGPQKAICARQEQCKIYKTHLAKITPVPVYIPTDEEEAANYPAPPTPAKPATAAAAPQRQAGSPTGHPPKANPVNIGAAKVAAAAPKTAKPATPQKTIARPQGVTPGLTPELASRAADKELAEARQAAEAVINLLEKQTWKDEHEARKAECIEKLREKANGKVLADVSTAQESARAFLAKVVKPGERKWDKLDGVDDFFLVPASRKAACEKLSEEAHALHKLVEEKITQDAIAKNADLAKKYAALSLDLQKLHQRPMHLHVNAKEHEVDRSQAVGGPEVTRIFRDFQALQKIKNDLAGEVRPLWIHGMRDRLAKEDPASHSHKMMANLGEVPFLEMAQMAELMAKKKHGADFQLFGPKFDGTKLTAAMDLSDIAAIYGYSTQDYSTLNAILRGTMENPADAAAKTGATPAAAAAPEDGANGNQPAAHIDYKPYIASCLSALSKLPPFTGKVQRADRNLPDVIINELIQRGTRTDKAFMSCGLKLVPGFGELISYIDGIKTAKEITMFSLHSTEGEVLFPPGSVLKFVRFKSATHDIFEHAKLAGVLTSKTTKGEIWFTQLS